MKFVDMISVSLAGQKENIELLIAEVQGEMKKTKTDKVFVEIDETSEILAKKKVKDFVSSSFNISIRTKKKANVLEISRE